MTYLLIGLVLLIMGLIVRAFLLRLVQRLVVGWTWLYTLGAPPEIRDGRRAEVRSDLWEQTTAGREVGYRPESIALHQLLRWLVGVPGDLSWRWARARPSWHALRRKARLGRISVRATVGVMIAAAIAALGFALRAVLGRGGPSQPELAALAASCLGAALATTLFDRILAWPWARPRRSGRASGGGLPPDVNVGLVQWHLRRLSAAEQHVVGLKFEAELTNAQIAQVMGLSEANVRVLLVRALQQLRNSLAHGG